MRLVAPWRDRSGAISSLKAGTFALMFAPAASMAWDGATGGLGPLPVIGLVYYSGVWATALLLLTLAVTPARTILAWNELVIVRRMIGVAALIHTLGHVVAYLMLDKWRWDMIAREMTTRPTLIVATIATLAMVALGATSFDRAVTSLGARGWRRLHRLNYALTILAVVHFLLSPGVFEAQYVSAGILFWLMAWRVLARDGRGADAFALAGLALAASAVTLALEFIWLAVYHKQAMADTLADLFDVAERIDPAWEVLALGLIVAALARWRARAVAQLR